MCVCVCVCVFINFKEQVRCDTGLIFEAEFNKFEF